MNNSFTALGLLAIVVYWWSTRKPRSETNITTVGDVTNEAAADPLPNLVDLAGKIDPEPTVVGVYQIGDNQILTLSDGTSIKRKVLNTGYSFTPVEAAPPIVGPNRKP